MLKKKKPEKKSEEDNFPREELSKHLGEEVEVYCLFGDSPRIKKGKLKSVPSKANFYYLKGSTTYAIFWDELDMYKKRDVTYMIKDSEGNIIFKNEDVPFNLEEALK